MLEAVQQLLFDVVRAPVNSNRCPSNKEFITVLCEEAASSMCFRLFLLSILPTVNTQDTSDQGLVRRLVFCFVLGGGVLQSLN
jgi:hypothetical protein